MRTLFFFISIFTLLYGLFYIYYLRPLLLRGFHCTFLGLFFQLYFLSFFLFNVSPHPSVSYRQVYLFRHLPILYFQPSSSQDDSRPLLISAFHFNPFFIPILIVSRAFYFVFINPITIEGDVFLFVGFLSFNTSVFRWLFLMVI